MKTTFTIMSERKRSQTPTYRNELGEISNKRNKTMCWIFFDGADRPSELLNL